MKILFQNPFMVNMKKVLFFFTGMVVMTGYGYTQVAPVLFAEGFTKPVTITHAEDERLFVVEQGGLIWIVNEDGTKESTPFLDLSNKISTGGNEQGLLGLAFHPGYTDNGYFFVNYTDQDGNTAIARFTVSADDPNLGNPESEQIILTFSQPFHNHNGGDLKFGPDGYLYIGTGDGGSAGDPNNYAQNMMSLLGKMLRIDVDNGDPYAIPEDNPYVEIDGAHSEIWATGLRNPWRFSFDKETGDMWIADVGQAAIEEINFIPAGSGSGWNFGWRCYEGENEYNMSNCGEASDYAFPVHQYLHSEEGGCSVTGGYVYRGEMYSSLDGHYFFTDYCNDILYSLHDSSGEWVLEKHGQFSGNSFTTFGEDQNGELYVAGIGSGKIFQITEDAGQTGILQDQSISQWIIYPNPAGNLIRIQQRENGKEAERIRILNVTGAVVLEPGRTEVHGNIDISSLETGMYFLEISAASKTYYQRFIRE